MTLTNAAQSPRNVSLQLDSPALASTYEEVSVRQFNHGKVLIASLRISSGERVLDIGCGTGRLGDFVAHIVAPEGEVIGIDPLPLRIDIAGKKHPRFKAQVGRAEDLSTFADASFDVVYLNSVFHWVPDKPQALREILRVLKPGGRFGVNSADEDRPHQTATLVREAVREEGLTEAAAASGFGTNYRVGQDELQALLTTAGFSGVHVDAHTFVDDVRDADDLIAWSSSSSFGNFLSDLDAGQRERVRLRLGHKLEQRRGPKGIQLERYLVFATAHKP